MVDIISSTQKLLIVDDDKEITTTLQLQLKDMGLKIISVNSGSDALEVIRNDSFISICILDINMPKMNGLQALEKIKKVNKNINVILISGIKDKKIIAKGIDLGACFYLIKPIKKQEIYSKIMSLFDKKPIEINHQIEVNNLPTPMPFTITKLCDEEAIFLSPIPLLKEKQILITSQEIDSLYNINFKLTLHTQDCQNISESEFCIISKILSPKEFVKPIVNTIKSNLKKVS